MTGAERNSHTVKSIRTSTNLKAWCAKQQLNRQRGEFTKWIDSDIGWFNEAGEEEDSYIATGEQLGEEKTTIESLKEEVNVKPRKKSVKIQTEPRVIEDVESDDLQWQPLSAGALTEYNGVSIRVACRPLKSSLKRNAMWRPPPCVSEAGSLTD